MALPVNGSTRLIPAYYVRMCGHPCIHLLCVGASTAGLEFRREVRRVLCCGGGRRTSELNGTATTEYSLTAAVPTARSHSVSGGGAAARHSVSTAALARSSGSGAAADARDDHELHAFVHDDDDGDGDHS